MQPYQPWCSRRKSYLPPLEKKQKQETWTVIYYHDEDPDSAWVVIIPNSEISRGDRELLTDCESSDNYETLLHLDVFLFGGGDGADDEKWGKYCHIMENFDPKILKNTVVTHIYFVSRINTEEDH